MKPGVYLDMPDDEYRALPAMSHSGLKQWISHSSIGRKGLVGSLLHARVLEGIEAVKARYVAAPEDYDLRTTEGKAAMAALEVEGKAAVRPRERAAAGAMYKALYADERASKALALPGPREVVIVGEFPGIKTQVKAKIDLMLDAVTVDLKSTGYPTQDLFINAIAEFGYAAQGAWYRDIRGHVTGTWVPFTWLCVSAMEPHDVWIQRLTNEQAAFGRYWYMTALKLYERYGKHDDEEVEDGD